jgi:hypothetical protein
LADQNIPDLLKLAGVRPSDKAAAAWLSEAVTGARRSFEAVKGRPLPADHNALLIDLEKSAKELNKRVKRLRRHPASWRAFWHSSVFGPVYCDRVELPAVLATLNNIVSAADAAKIRHTGRPRRTDKQRVVNLAFGFFVRFSAHRPSGTQTGAFAKFARRFYAVVTGADPDDHGGLDRQIRQAQKRLPMERQRATKLRRKT